jgi:hypothetical protein
VILLYIYNLISLTDASEPLPSAHHIITMAHMGSSWPGIVLFPRVRYEVLMTDCEDLSYLLPPSSGYLSPLSYSFTLKIGATGSSETLVPLNQTTGCPIPANSDPD